MSADTQSSNVPAAQPNRAIAEPGGFAIPGLERFAPQEMIVADLKIGQGTTRVEGVTAGKLYNSLDPKEQWDSLILIPLTYGHGRVLFPRTPDGKPDYDAPIPCRSDDGLVPAPSIEKPIAPKCVADIRGEELCPMAKWGADRTKPKCAETATLVVLAEELGLLPFRFSVKGADCTTLRKMLSNLKQKAMGRRLALYDFRFKLSTISEKNDQGKWFGPAFTELSIVEEPGKYVSFHAAYAAAVVPTEPEKPAATAPSSAADAGAPSNDSATTAPPAATPPAAEPKATSPKGKPKF